MKTSVWSLACQQSVCHTVYSRNDRVVFYDAVYMHVVHGYSCLQSACQLTHSSVALSSRPELELLVAL